MAKKENGKEKAIDEHNITDRLLRICYLYREYDALREKLESMLRMNGGVVTPIFEIEKGIAEDMLKKLETDIHDFVSRVNAFDFSKKD